VSKLGAAWIGLLGLAFFVAASSAAQTAGEGRSEAAEAGRESALEEAAAPLGDELGAPLEGGEIPLAEADASPAAAGVGAGFASEAHTEIERAWHAPAASLEERVARTRRSALGVGAWNLDPAARAIATGGVEGDPLERAQAAVTLAPDLPAARMELARALWLHGDSPMSAIRSAIEAVAAIGRHLEASLWFSGTALYVLAAALVIGSLLAILIAAIFVSAHAAHDLGHLISPNTPLFAQFALLGFVLLLPLVLGEGGLGLALAALAVAIVYGRPAQRVALALAAAALVAGLYPVARSAGAILEAFPSDPVARAAYTSAQGLVSPVELARLDAAAEGDELAARGLAIHARRTGNLGTADAVYQRLLQEGPADLVLMNNAANVRLELGHMESALDLYGRALELEESPVVLFNLSQAYGRAFQVDDLNQTLALAQAVDAELVAELMALQGGESKGFVVDLPLPNQLMWSRVLESGRGGGIASEFRAHLVSGRLGHNAELLGVAAILVVLVASLIGARFQPSRWCGRCGARMCPRCDAAEGEGDLCESCTRLFLQPEKTDRNLRLARVNELREREERINRITTIISMLIPAAAGILAKRPLSSLLGGFFFALALCFLVWRGGVVPDPLVAGSAAPFVFVGVAVLAFLSYAAVVATALAARGSR
jgi:tetratricopeptide (TPR) repeat protein